MDERTLHACLFVMVMAIVVPAGHCGALPPADAEVAPAEPPAATQPASQPAATSQTAPLAPPDLCKDVIDPYNDGAERTRFFRAAGVDSELDAGEFEAARGKEDSFVRSYDRWDILLLFDKNHNGRIDWFEADAYRWDVRKRILGAFDGDHDGHLRGPERDAANESLARGVVPGRPGVPYAPPDAHLPPPPPSPYFQPDYAALMKKFDSNGDGQLSAEEWQALTKHVGELQNQWQLDRYDKNHDGKLDEAELKAMNDDRVAWAAEMARRADLIAWDKNKDGKLDEEEQAACDEYKDRLRRQSEEARKKYEEMVKKFDKDGDGKLNEEERKAMMEEYQRQAEIQRWDTNKDGVLDDQERAEMEKEKAQWQRVAELQKKWYLDRYDTDGDGVLSPEETKAISADYQRRQLERWDADGDGQLSEQERLVMANAFRDRYEKMRKLMDSDGDGQISPEEARAWQKHCLEKYDANKDGWIDPDEQEKMNDDLDKAETPP